MSVMHRTPSTLSKRLHCSGFLATRIISSTTSLSESTRRSMNVLPWKVKKYFSCPFVRRAWPPTRTIADLTAVLRLFSYQVWYYPAGRNTLLRYTKRHGERSFPRLCHILFFHGEQCLLDINGWREPADTLS